MTSVNLYGGAPLTTASDTQTPTVATQNLGTPQAVDSDKLLAELLKMLEGTPESQQQGGSNVTDSRGAPAIDAPSKEFSASDMVDLLRNLRGKSQDAQLQTAQHGLESARIKSEKNTEQQVEKIKEWIDKCKEADDKSLVSKIFGWIGKIVAAIAAIAAVAVAAVATVATGGAAAPLLALAVVGAIGATMSLADQISKECGGPEISLSSLMQATVGKFLEAVGVPKDQAELISKVVGGALGIMMPVALLIEPQLLGGMAQGIAKLAGASDETAGYIGMAIGMAAALTIGIAMAAASGGSTLGSTSLKLASGIISATSQITQGVTSVTQGSLGIATAADRKDAQNLQADKKTLEALMVKIQKQMEEGREELKKVIQQIEESTQIVSKMLAGATESMEQITANIGKRSTV